MRDALEESVKQIQEKRKRGGDGTGRRRTAAEQLDDLTKTELYERARELELPGRSAMSRGELIDALQRAGTASGRTRA